MPDSTACRGFQCAGHQRRHRLIDFSFTAEQEAFRDVLRDFAKERLLPVYTRWDRERIFPKSLWTELGQLGVTGLRIPEEYGGAAVDGVTTGIAAEEVARGDFNLAYAVLLHALVGEVITRHGSTELKAAWLPSLASGDKVFGIAVTEPDAGSDAAAMRTRAERTATGYRLTGEKSGISVATVADAFVVFAKTDAAAGARGISAFLVPAHSAGVSTRAYDDMGSTAVARGSVFLDAVDVPASYLIGAENRGFHAVMNGFDLSRLVISLMSVGAAMQSLDETIAHVKTRHAFGQPLAKFQGVAFPIAEHWSKLELVRWHAYRALWLRDAGRPHTREAAIAKWLGPKFAVAAAHDCLLLNGHYGYTKELPFEQRLRDLIGLEIGDGTAQTQQMIIARDLIGVRPY